MKNQYFGDFYDYIKYSLLRLITNYGQVPSAVCWLMTPNDGRSDGHKIQYLLEPGVWEDYDSTVFRFLRRQVIDRQVRSVDVLESSGILPNFSFFSDIVDDREVNRGVFFKRFLEFSHSADLVFFDPDNGMEVKSAPFGRKKSSRYLYWQEAKDAFSAGHSLFVYQHFPPKPREALIKNITNRFALETSAATVYSFATNRVAFFLVPQPDHTFLFEKSLPKISEIWGDHITINKHSFAAID